LRQIKADGGLEETRERAVSLLKTSGFEVLRDGDRSFRFRKVRLAPSRRIPLLFYGSGVIKLEPMKGGSTRVTYRLSISPATVFAYLVTGLSIAIAAIFVNYLLLTSVTSSGLNVTVTFLVTNAVSIFVLFITIISFVKTKNRAEQFLRAFLERSIDV
jgi:hypothetical protein